MTTKDNLFLCQNGEHISNMQNIKKLGFFLVVLSCVLYGGLLLVPFAPYTLGVKAAVSSTLVILGELSFWLGALILGKELVAKYRKYLNPFCWFKKKSD